MMSLERCAIIEKKEETGDGARLDVSLFCSLAIGETLLIFAPDKSFVIEGILSGDEPITEAGEGTTVAILLKAPLRLFPEGAILYKKIEERIATESGFCGDCGQR